MRVTRKTSAKTKLRAPMFKGIQTILEINAHINTADFVRDLIRRDLEERGVKIEETHRCARAIKIIIDMDDLTYGFPAIRFWPKPPTTLRGMPYYFQ